MLKIKDNVDLSILKDYGFQKGGKYDTNRPYILYDGSIVKVYIDNKRIIHFNCPTQKQLDLIFKMHNLLEEATTNYKTKVMSRNDLLLMCKNQEEQLKANDLMINDLLNRIKKAIKKLNSAVDHYEDLSTDWALKCTIKILKGEEIEIPQFEGTLEQLDKLSIKGE